MAKGIIRLVSSISAGETSALVFDYSPDLGTEGVVSSPVITATTLVGSADLAFTPPSINTTEPDGSKHRTDTRISTAVTCPANATGGKWHIDCEAIINGDPYKKMLSAELVQVQ